MFTEALTGFGHAFGPDGRNSLLSQDYETMSLKQLLGWE